MESIVTNKPWKTALGIALFYTLSFGLYSRLLATTLLVEPVQINADLNLSFLRFLLVFMYVIVMIGQLIAGKMYGKYNLKKILILSYATCVLSQIMATLVQQAELCYIAFFIGWLSAGFFIVSFPVLVNTYFSKKVGFAFVIIHLLWLYFMQPLANFLLKLNISKWQISITSITSISLISLCLSVIVLLFLIPKAPIQKQAPIKYKELFKIAPSSFCCFFIAYGLFSASFNMNLPRLSITWSLLVIMIFLLFPIYFGLMYDKQKIMWALIGVLVIEIFFSLLIQDNFYIIGALNYKVKNIMVGIIMPLLIIYAYRENFTQAFLLITLSPWLYQFSEAILKYIINHYHPSIFEHSLQLAKFVAVAVSIGHVVACALCILGYWLAKRRAENKPLQS